MTHNRKPDALPVEGASIAEAREYVMSCGTIVLVSPEDSDLLEQTWIARKNASLVTRYAARSQRVGSRRVELKMHRVIAARMFGQIDGAIVDHRNRNGLDNRRSNIRLASKSQNGANSEKPKRRSTSRFKGVFLNNAKWCATIKSQGVRRNLGRYDSEEAAALAYDAKARELFGEFACCNFPAGTTLAQAQALPAPPKGSTP